MSINYCYDCRHNVSFPTVPHTKSDGLVFHKLGKATVNGETRELRKTHKKASAQWKLCAGVVNDGISGHAMRDNCWNCPPFWEVYPVCPEDKKALTTNGYCKMCRKHFDLSDRPSTKDLVEHNHAPERVIHEGEKVLWQCTICKERIYDKCRYCSKSFGRWVLYPADCGGHKLA